MIYCKMNQRQTFYNFHLFLLLNSICCIQVLNLPKPSEETNGTGGSVNLSCSGSCALSQNFSAHPRGNNKNTFKPLSIIKPEFYLFENPLSEDDHKNALNVNTSHKRKLRRNVNISQDKKPARNVSTSHEQKLTGNVNASVPSKQPVIIQGLNDCDNSQPMISSELKLNSSNTDAVSNKKSFGVLQLNKTAPVDVGNLSMNLNLTTAELECYTCNGEVMLERIRNFVDKSCYGCFRTTFSISANVFKLVQTSDPTHPKWTRSECVHDFSLCRKCQEEYWFVRRPDGICKRFYIYFIAMSVDDISIDFDDMSKMTYFMICFLKRHFQFDVLEEWYPPMIVFDVRLNIYLYVARFLVYDVHHASIKDAVNQIRQLSFLTNSLRQYHKNILKNVNDLKNTEYTFINSFDIEDQMRTFLEFYNLAQCTNRSTCVCKIVLGALISSNTFHEINNFCILVCFLELSDAFESKLEQQLGTSCFIRNFCDRHFRLSLLTYAIVLYLYFYFMKL